MKNRLPGAVFVLALLLAACAPMVETPRPGQVCTLIGCDDGLSVRLDESFRPPFTVEVSALGQETRTVRCTVERPCTGGFFLSDFTPDVVTIRVLMGDEWITRTIRTEYGTVQPNGPGCPPTCRQGVVDVG